MKFLVATLVLLSGLVAQAQDLSGFNCMANINGYPIALTGDAVSKSAHIGAYHLLVEPVGSNSHLFSVTIWGNGTARPVVKGLVSDDGNSPLLYNASDRLSVRCANPSI
jgi:hypothetical protein